MQQIKLVIFLLISTIQSCQPALQKKEDGNNLLVGSWKFIADQELDSNNKVINEDRQVTGLLIYTGNGKMSVQLLWYGRRTAMMNDTIMHQDGISVGVGLGNNSWTIDQARKIIDTYDAYFGDYLIDWKNKIVTHTISGNLRPEKPGIFYKRSFHIKGDSLFLRSADPNLQMRWQTAWIKSNK